MSTMNWRSILPFLALIALCYGCGAPANGVADPAKPKSYGKVVSLSPSTSELMADLGAVMYLVGRDESSDRPEEMQNVEIVTKNIKPNYARITELQPDLIVYDATLYNADDVAQLEKLGFETL